MTDLHTDFVFTAEAEVTPHPDCPVCGREGCETNHTATEESQ